FVPQTGTAQFVQCIGDENKVFQKFDCQILIHRIVLRQFESNSQHVQTVEGHPGGAVCLLEATARGQGIRTVENSDVVQPEKSSGKEIGAFVIGSIHPPGEIEKKFLKYVL